MSLTLFSWGYWGWGNATRQLIEAVDIAETMGKYRPPIFVEVRILRQGRAKGFVGDAFRDTVTPSRYRWMQDLGNCRVATGGSGVKIKNPAAVAELVQLAVDASHERRHVIFYCACPFPWLDGELRCHRHTIADLLLAHAKKIGRSISVVEWPGGEPTTDGRVKVNRQMFSSLMRTRKSVPFDKSRLDEFAGLPWGSILTVECAEDGRTGLVAVGPARFATAKDGPGYWYLPIIDRAGLDATKESMLRRAARWRTAHGLDERSSR